MKSRESGMPDEAWWASFFNPERLLQRLLPSDGMDGPIVEFGSGYGTFTVPAARMTSGIVTALDIEPSMVDHLRRKAEAHSLPNIRPVLRDVVVDGTDLADNSQAHAMIFNLLHLEDPVALLLEARRTLAAGGRVSVLHWRSDIPTPRGPSLDIRPSPAQCAAWMREAGFVDVAAIHVEDLCPYHFALVGTRSDDTTALEMPNPKE